MAVSAILMSAPSSICADAGRVQAQAQLLDHAEYLCDNCFFGASKYYYCFAADSKILIGYQKAPVLNYQDQSKNYLAPVHPAWAAWAAPGQTAPISYDEKHIWLTRTKEKPASTSFWSHLKNFAFWASRGEDKRVKLRRASNGDLFTNNAQCQAVGASIPAH
jgi:hypothetical protein